MHDILSGSTVFLREAIYKVIINVFVLFQSNSGTIDFREYVIGLSLISQPASTESTIQLAFTVSTILLLTYSYTRAVSSDFRLGVGFCFVYSGFLQHFQLASHVLAAIWQKT